MITKYSNAAEHYDELFLKATERLEKLNAVNHLGEHYSIANGVKVTSLEEYFSNLRNLVYGPSGELTQSEIEEGYVFLKVPVDEPYFVVDANKREVIVPDVFKKNGISVLGDEVSEILFFQVDRFYDATDLSQLDIAFYWSHAGDEHNTIYSTPAFFSVVESDQLTGDDKLIFGWPISSEMTKQAGRITFSVRFFQKDERVSDASDEFSLLYSLSTLPQTVFINQGLTYDIKGIDVDNRLDYVLSKRLKNSPFAEENPTEPFLVFLRTIENGKISDTQEISEQVTPSGVTFAALGSKLGSGTLSYAWYHEGLDGTTTEVAAYAEPDTRSSDSYIVTDEFISTNNGTIATYYYKSNGEYYSLTLGQGDFNAAKAEYGVLYVRCSTLTVDDETVEAGTYFAVPKNRLGKKEAVATSATAASGWSVHGAEVPAISAWTSWDDEIVFTNDSTHMAGGKIVLQIAADITPGDEVYYYWLLNRDEDTIVGDFSEIPEDSFVNISGEEGGSSSLVPMDENGDYVEGYYKVQVVTTRNNDIKEITSDAVLVLNPISSFENDITYTDINKEITITHRAKEKFENITYFWTFADKAGVTTTEPVYFYGAETKPNMVEITVSKSNKTKTAKIML